MGDLKGKFSRATSPLLSQQAPQNTWQGTAIQKGTPMINALNTAMRKALGAKYDATRRYSLLAAENPQREAEGWTLDGQLTHRGETFTIYSKSRPIAAPPAPVAQKEIPNAERRPIRAGITPQPVSGGGLKAGGSTGTKAR